MENDYILNLSDPRSNLAVAGGKGASLTRLLNAGLPVPDGFTVTTAAYQKFVAENDLQPRILSALEKVDTLKPESMETSSQVIQNLFEQGSIPKDIIRGIDAGYHSMAGPTPAVAVRSSATAEDLPDLSFAGQQETFLNISGLDEVLNAVKRCWASLWTGRAIGYRLQHGIAQDSVSLAVVIQRLVNAEISGILFTANPVSGQRDEVVINASWGLGEAIVGGIVTPDTFFIDRKTGKTRQSQIANKNVMTVRTHGGTTEQPVPESKRKIPALDRKQIVELVRLADRIETLSGCPQDMEWCVTDGKFQIVQSRPITNLPETPVEWKMPDAKGLYMRASVIDLMPAPLSPLFATLALPDIVNKGLSRIFSEFTKSNTQMPENYYVTINGFGYAGMNFTASFWWWIIVRMIPAMIKLLKFAPTYWRTNALPEYLAIINRLKTIPFEDHSVVQLWQSSQELTGTAMYYVASLLASTMGSSAGAEMLFNSIYLKMVKKEGDPDPSVFLLGYNSQPILAEKMLFDLAHWAGAHPDVAAYILNTPAFDLTQTLTRQPPDFPAGFSEFSSRMNTYLEQYGHMVYDLDFVNPLPAENPAPMIETIKMYLRGQGANPHDRQGSAAEKRLQASAAMLERTKGLKGWAFRTSLRMAQAMSEVREDALAGIGTGYPCLRRLLAELGSRLAAAGVITQKEDIYWLEKNEIDLAVAKVESGQVCDSLSMQVEQRKKANAAAGKLTPPSMLPARKKSYFGFQMDLFLPADASTQTGSVLKGIAASPGKVTAPARVLNGPQDFEQMRPGEVLVANLTTPAWTPLFAMASAVVTNIGGPLSHGSIVAREYGIPAVLGTGVATNRIRNGQSITVDGQAGTVRLN